MADFFDEAIFVFVKDEKEEEKKNMHLVGASSSSSSSSLDSAWKFGDDSKRYLEIQQKYIWRYSKKKLYWYNGIMEQPNSSV